MAMHVDEVQVELLKMVDEVQIELHEEDHEEEKEEVQIELHEEGHEEEKEEVQIELHEKEDGGDDDSKKQDVVPNHELLVDVGEEKKSEGEAKEQHEEEESEGDGDGDDDSTKQDFVPNHELLVDVGEEKKSEGEEKKKKKSTKKPKSTSTVTLGKRRAYETDHKQKEDLKKKKNGDHGWEESVKKPFTNNNLWSKDDEIVILKGMVRLMKEKMGEKPNLKVLLEKIKDSLSVDVTKDQLRNKLRKLKDKHEANVVKGTVQFSSTHDFKRYKLSNKIWYDIDLKANNGNRVEDSAAKKEEVKSKSRGKASKTIVSPLQLCNESASIDEKSLPLPSFFNEVMESAWENSVVPPGLKGLLGKEALGIIRSSKVKDLEHKWKNLQMAEAKINLELNHLTQEKVKLLLVALGHSEE